MDTIKKMKNQKPDIQLLNGRQKKNKSSQNKYKMHLVLNTHWDREYRWSFVETQSRLVEAVDLLIDTMEKDSRFAYFHTDSQASFLDDYLEVRPENTNRVKKLVSEGRILTGPWYTLPAEFLVSGEALVRNLQMGHKIARDLGKVMKTGYNIFSWGQVSQLPQLYRQFGMDAIMFYRGIDQSNLDRLEFKWKAPDGTEALGVTFGSYHRLNFWVYVYRPYNEQGGYDRKKIIEHGGSFFNLCDVHSKDLNQRVIHQPQLKSFQDARKGLDALLDTVKDVSSTQSLLFLQGFDQENPDPVVPDLIEKLNTAIDFGQIQVSTIGDYLAEVRQGLAEKGLLDKLKVFNGEMLHVEQSGDPFAPLYNGVFSARMPLKQMNTDCENRLENWAEPCAVWANLLGRSYPHKSLEMAWKELLKNQQHDGIGGCHVDRVTLTIEERYRNVKDLAEVVTRDSLGSIESQIDYSHLGDEEIGITVFNASSVTRTEIVTAEVDIPHDWGLRFIPGHAYKRPITVRLYDSQNKQIESQLLSLEDDCRYAYLKYGSHISISVTKARIVFPAEAIPPMGYKTFRLTAEQSVDRPIETLAPENNVLENEYIKAVIHSDGRIDLIDKITSRQYKGLHYFEDDGEMGGPLIHQRPCGNGIYTTIEQPAEVALVCAGPLYATYKIERSWNLPEGNDSETKIHVPHGAEWVDHGKVQRSSRKKTLTITTEITLRKGSRLLEFKTELNNTIRDHRLRVCFDSQLENARYCYVDSPFDIAKRDIQIPDSSGWYEEAARTLPTHSFVDVTDGQSGLAVLHKGLAEYEVVDNRNRTIALTLLRCFGTAGNPSETYRYQSLAQCPGHQVFEYAVVPHDGGWLKGDILNWAEFFNAPMRIAQSTRHEGVLPRECSFIETDNIDFVVTALKKSDKEGYILRGFNPTKEPIVVNIKLPVNIRSAEKVTLEENKIETVEIHKGCVKIKVNAGEIYSLKFSR